MVYNFLQPQRLFFRLHMACAAVGFDYFHALLFLHGKSRRGISADTLFFMGDVCRCA